MTIIRQGPGTVLLLSGEELPSPALTREELLPFLRRVLSRDGHPLPPALDIRIFPGKNGALFLLLPAFDAPKRNFFRDFS